MILALGIVAIPQLGRITRANALDLVAARVRARGTRPRRPQLPDPRTRDPAQRAARDVLGRACSASRSRSSPRARLSLLGAGVKTGTITWGTMIVGGRDDLETAPWVVLAPATAIFFTVFALNYLGDVIRVRFDVREAAL